MPSIGPVLIDGEAVAPDAAAVSVFDIALQRGFGCFEALRAYQGAAFRQWAHLDRLERSAAALGLPLPPREDLDAWVTDRAAEGDAVIRVVVTGGTDSHASGEGSRVIVFAEPMPDVAPEMTLLPVAAPWHPDGEVSELTGAKTLSYGPNFAARLAAIEAGFDDALLVGRSGRVLEGPTYSIAWVRDGVVETPSLDLGILASVTRAAVVEVAHRLGFEVREGRFPLARVGEAAEVMVLSTVKEVTPVVRVGETVVARGPVVARLQEGFTALVRQELGLA
jgi:branched-chain amino acid aminotransferase